jgi:hypothetical protein
VTFGKVSGIVRESATAAKTLFSFVRMPQEDGPDGLRVDSAAAQLRIASQFVPTGGSGLHAADTGAG